MVLYAMVKTVRMIPPEIVMLTVIFTAVWTALAIVCRTISQTVFRIALRRVFPTISNIVQGMR
ncbi:MAG: hypothetical protein NTX53_14355 [candidate division WOR-3 bacterium]|nr:hypothetical protein [candidate division WOR-3 bacterium]